MANINLTINNISNRFIHTDKGDIILYVVNCNENFNVGDNITPPNLKMYESIGTIISWSPQSGVFATGFDVGWFKGVLETDSSGNKYLNYTIYDGDAVLESGSISKSNNWRLNYMNYLFRSPNGNVICQRNSAVTAYTWTVDASSIINRLPSDDVFGIFKCNNDFALNMDTRSYVISDRMLRKGYIVYYGTEGPNDDNDPFKPGGGSTGDGSDGGVGGGGDFDGESIPIEIPSLPSLSAVSTGFITIYSPTQSQMNNLANYMWGDLFDINSWKKIFADPMDAILGLSIVPLNIPTSGTSEVTVGNIGTGISMNRVSSQYVTVDCGSLNLNEFWGAYLDYSPYTKVEIYLPYIGHRPLDTDDVMGKSIHVVYHVDILSGGLCCYVKCGESVLYEYNGQASCSIPITGNDWTNVINGALNIAQSIGTVVASGGVTAPVAIGSAINTASNAIGMKPTVERSGAISGMGGMLGIQTPYLIVTRPRQALPPKQNTFTGYPSLITAKLSTLKGYTEVDDIHLSGMTCTTAEADEIVTLLKGGVIIS